MLAYELPASNHVKLLIRYLLLGMLALEPSTVLSSSKQLPAHTSLKLVRNAQRPVRVMPSHVPPRMTSLPANTSGLSSQKCAGSVGLQGRRHGASCQPCAQPSCKDTAVIAASAKALAACIWFLPAIELVSIEYQQQLKARVGVEEEQRQAHLAALRQ